MRTFVDFLADSKTLQNGVTGNSYVILVLDADTTAFIEIFPNFSFISKLSSTSFRIHIPILLHPIFENNQNWYYLFGTNSWNPSKTIIYIVLNFLHSLRIHWFFLQKKKTFSQHFNNRSSMPIVYVSFKVVFLLKIMSFATQY